jgi:hypothetical protein
MPTVDINILAVIVAAILNVVVGALWYNAPFLFNRPWLAGIGKTAEQVAADFTILKPLGALVGALVIALLLALLIGWSGAASLVQGALIGLLIAVGFTAINNGIKDLFEGRPAKLWLINAGHDVVILTAMGALIGAWR